MYLLIGQATGEGYYSTFGRCIIKQVPTADVRVDGRAIDYSRSLFHVRYSVFRKVIHGMDIGAKATFPLRPVIKELVSIYLNTVVIKDLLVQFADVIEHVLECSVVHQNVDAAQAFESRVNYLLAVFLRANIDRQGVTAAVSFLDPLFRFLRITFLLREVDNEARCAF